MWFKLRVCDKANYLLDSILSTLSTLIDNSPTNNTLICSAGSFIKRYPVGLLRSRREQEKGAGHHLLRILSTFSASTSGFGLNEKVDKEQARKKSSEGDCHVGTKLDLKCNRSGGHRFNNGVQGKGGSGKGGNGQSTSGDLSSSLGHYKFVKLKVRINVRNQHGWNQNKVKIHRRRFPSAE